MTDNEKMREEFEDWYMRIHPHIHYMVRTPTDGYANRHAQELWGIWQAAKSVPVAGEPYLYVRSVHDGWPEYSKEDEFSDGKGGGLALYLKPTTSIAEDELKDLRMCKIAAQEEARRVDELTAELERLRKDAERWRAALVISQATLCRPDTREPRVNSMLNAYRRAVNTGVDMTGAVDAAIAGEKEEKE